MPKDGHFAPCQEFILGLLVSLTQILPKMLKKVFGPKISFGTKFGQTCQKMVILPHARKISQSSCWTSKSNQFCNITLCLFGCICSDVSNILILETVHHRFFLNSAWIGGYKGKKNSMAQFSMKILIVYLAKSAAKIILFGNLRKICSSKLP